MKTVIYCLVFLFSLHQLYAQNVGIGTSSPAASALLHLNSTSKGFLMPRMTSSQRSAIASPAVGLMVYDTDTKATYQYDGVSWQKSLNSSFWNSSASANFVYNTTDSIGIGTSSPDEKLHVSNGNLKLSRTSLNADNSIWFNMPNPQLAGEFQGLKFQVFGNDKSSIGFLSAPLVNPPVEGIRLSGNGLSSNDLFVSTAGNVGMGTSSPVEKLDLRGNMNINSTNPTLQLQNDGIDKGFIQLSSDNIRLGTNSSNTAGKLVFRLAGADRIFVEPDGKMGLGVPDAAAKLHINSGSSAEALRIQGDDDAIIRFMTGAIEKSYIYSVNNDLNISTVQPNGLLRLNGEIYINNTANKTGIGTTAPEERLHVVGNVKVSTGKVLNADNQNMTALAWAKFNSAGTKLAGTANITATARIASNGVPFYSITVNGATLQNAVVNITTTSSTTFAHTIDNYEGYFAVLIYNLNAGEIRHNGFQIVVYY